MNYFHLVLLKIYNKFNVWKNDQKNDIPDNIGKFLAHI